jgi:Phage major capsid protein E
MANIVYDLVDPVELTQYIREWDNEVLRPEAKFQLERFLPNQETEDLDFKLRKGGLQDVDAAEFRAFDTPASMTGRQGVTRIAGSLGPVSRQIPLGEEESLRVKALDRGTNDPLINAIYDDAELMTRSVQARIELARGDLIDDGVVTIEENGLTLEADWGRDPSMSETAGTLWSDTANADPITDLLTWQETYETLNGTVPAYFRITRQILGWLQLNAEIRSYAAANGTTPQRVNAETISSILAAEGLPQPWIYESKVRVDGVRTNILPSNKIYLMPSDSEPLGNTMYGMTAESVKLVEKGLIKQSAAPGIVALVLQNEHPVQTFTLATAIALPVMPNPDLVMDVVVSA